MSNVINKFMIFLLAILVIVTIGLTLFYFLRSEETFSLSDGADDNLIRYVNVGDTLDITVYRTNPSGAEYSLISSDDAVIKFKEKVSENVFRFETEGSVGGSAEIKLQTENSKYSNLSLTVRVGVGSSENPFYIRDYNDLASIGKNGIFTLSSHYFQVADIDMSVAESEWTPIAYNKSFDGTYNGNGHTISNFSMTQVPESDEVNNNVDNTNTSATTEKGAGLFYVIGLDSTVTKLNVKGVNIEGNFDTVGVIAGGNQGIIKNVNVTEASIKINNNTAFVGGICGGLVGNIEYSSKVLYSSFQGKIEGGNTAGGIAGANFGGLVMDNYSIGSISSQTPEAIVGGVVGLNTSIVVTTSLKASVVNNYAVMTFAGEQGYVGGIVGKNVNNNGTSTIVINTTNDNEKAYNRIYGNYYLQISGSRVQGIGNLTNSTDSYIALPQLKSSMNSIPTKEDIARINTENEPFDCNLAYVTYAQDGTYTSWNFEDIWDISISENDNYPFIRSVLMPTNEYVYNGEPTTTPSTPVDPSEPENPTDPDDPEQDVITQDELEAMFASDLEANEGKEYTKDYYIEKDVVLTRAWTPIGTKEQPFNGKFEMAPNKTIYNLIIEDCGTQYYGLFGYLGTKADISRINVRGIDINLDDAQEETIYVGVIAGYSSAEKFNLITKTAIYVNGDDATTANRLNVENKKNVYMGSIVGYIASYSGGFGNSHGSVNMSIKNCSGKLVIGGVAGYSAGFIVNSSYSGVGFGSNASFLNVINANNDKAQSIYIGGVVGQNLGLVAESEFDATINTSSQANAYSGGIVGYNEGMVRHSVALGNINGGYYAGGLVGYYKVSELSFMFPANGIISDTDFIKQSYSLCNVTGNRVGGLVGIGVSGTITNCYNECNLSGNVMGGFAADLLYGSEASCAKITYCYSAATFDVDAGKAYWETSSVIRQTNGWWAGNKKLAGYIENCIYNIHDDNPTESAKIDSIERQYSYYILDVGYDCDDGRTTDDDCRKISTFTDRGFSLEIWELSEGSYPKLV